MIAFAESRARLVRDLLVGAVVALPMVACGPNLKPPDVKLNPAPKQRYEITLTIEKPHAEVSDVAGSLQFDIDNEDCVPLADPIAGVRKHTKFFQTITFRQVGDKYVSDLYVDPPLSSDYYGLGSCRWSLTSVEAKFKVDALERATYFDAAEVIGQESVRSLCPLSTVLRDICLTPQDEQLYVNPQHHFVAKLKSRKTSL